MEVGQSQTELAEEAREINDDVTTEEREESSASGGDSKVVDKKVRECEGWAMRTCNRNDDADLAKWMMRSVKQSKHQRLVLYQEICV